MDGSRGTPWKLNSTTVWKNVMSLNKLVMNLRSRAALMHGANPSGAHVFQSVFSHKKTLAKKYKTFTCLVHYYIFFVEERRGEIRAKKIQTTCGCRGLTIRHI